jgi:hypothetical protein
MRIVLKAGERDEEKSAYIRHWRSRSHEDRVAEEATGRTIGETGTHLKALFRNVAQLVHLGSGHSL